MKKIKISLLLAIILSFSGTIIGQVDDSLTMAREISNRIIFGVKSISEVKYPRVDGVLSKKGVIISKEYYESTGLPVESFYYSDDGSFISHNKTEYDEYGNVTKNIIYDSLGIVNNYTIMKYSGKDIVTEINYYNSDKKLYSKSIYKYDKSGNLIYTSVFDSTGTETDKSEYFYDSKNRLVKSNEYYNNNMNPYVTNIKYDNNDNEIERSETDVTGKVTNLFIKKYEKNLIVESIVYSDGKLSYRDVYKYDEFGNQTITETFNEDNILSSRSENKYDANGNILYYLYSNPNDPSTSYYQINEFDANNNVLSKTEYTLDGKLKIKDLFKYDKQNNLIEHKTIDNYNIENIVMIASYDDFGNQLLLTYFDEDGNETYSVKRKYDSNGFLLEYEYSDAYYGFNQGLVKIEYEYSK